MHETLEFLSTLRRPRLLIRAARFGLDDYRRDRDLKRILRTQSSPPTSAAISKLVEEETRLEQIRLEGSKGYSVSRHVDVMIALMAEIRLRLGTTATG